jgi:hypothetical protein
VRNPIGRATSMKEDVVHEDPNSVRARRRKMWLHGGETDDPGCKENRIRFATIDADRSQSRETKARKEEHQDLRDNV